MVIVLTAIEWSNGVLFAATGGHFNTVRLLPENSAEVNAQDNVRLNGRTFAFSNAI